MVKLLRTITSIKVYLLCRIKIQIPIFQTCLKQSIKWKLLIQNITNHWIIIKNKCIGIYQDQHQDLKINTPFTPRAELIVQIHACVYQALIRKIKQLFFSKWNICFNLINNTYHCCEMLLFPAFMCIVLEMLVLCKINCYPLQKAKAKFMQEKI